MIKYRLLGIVFLLMIIMPLALAVIEEDWGKYIRVVESKRDAEGQEITLNWLRRSYTNPDKTYTVNVKDFDAQGTVILNINYSGRNETFLLSGKWNENRTKVILPEPIEAFDKKMIITTLEITAPVGIFTCCPETRININLKRPELFLEFNEDKDMRSNYRLVNPYGNWNISVDRDNPYISPFDSSVERKSTTLENQNAYRINDEIPMEITVTNFGDDESQNTILYIDTDGLLFENGKSSYELPPLRGENQFDFNGLTNITTKIKLKFPSHPEKVNYSVHAYVKGEKNNVVYYYDAIKVISLAPSIDLQKSVTKESMLMNRTDVESFYPSVNSDEISRWLQNKDIFVTIGVSNYKNNEIKNINLYDTLNSQFIVENNTLNWTFDLKPGETREFTYKIITDSPGTYTLPSALLTFSEYNLTWNLISNTPITEVHGPCIQILKKPGKSVIFKGNNTNITITLRNNGDMPAKVEVNDSLPQNSTLMGGQIYYKGSLLPKESVVFSYIFLIDDEGQIELPNPILYINGKESPVCGELLTSRILVRKYSPPKPLETIIVPQTPVEIQNPAEVRDNLLAKYSWLEGVIPAFMLILAIIVLFMLYRKNI